MRTEPAGGRPVLTGIGDEAALGIDGQIAAVTALGWRAVELRTVDGTPLAELSLAAFDRTAGALADAGVAVAAVDARIGGWSRPVTGDFAADLAELAALEGRCARLGTRYVRVMSYPNDGLDAAGWEREVLRRVQVLAGRAHAAGLTLLHENCAGWAGADADRMVRLLDAAGPGLDLLFDTGNGPAYGYDAHRLLTALLPHADRIAHVHIKDAYQPPAAPPRYCPPGTGDLRIADSLRLLLTHGYQGALSIEPHVAVRPHESHRAPEAECAAAFTECGVALERLVTEALSKLPGTGGSAGAGGVSPPGVRSAGCGSAPAASRAPEGVAAGSGVRVGPDRPADTAPGSQGAVGSVPAEGVRGVAVTASGVREDPVFRGVAVSGRRGGSGACTGASPCGGSEGLSGAPVAGALEGAGSVPGASSGTGEGVTSPFATASGAAEGLAARTRDGGGGSVSASGAGCPDVRAFGVAGQVRSRCGAGEDGR